MSGHDPHLPPDLAEVGQRLRDARPRLEPVELDRLTSTTTRMKGTYMKTRLVILTTLVVGILMMGTGGALAVSSLSAGSTSAQGEYHNNGGSGVSPGGNTLGGGGGGGGAPAATASGSGGGGTAPSVPETAQATRQVSTSDSGSLPFTGFLAIPVLLVGVGLLGTGIVLRRRLDATRS